MKLGIIGTGMIVRDFLQILPQLKLERVSIFGRNPEQTKALAQTYEISQIFCDYEEMLASDADTLYIALPNDLHFSFAEKALKAGKHIILEKPITPSLSEFQALRRLAEEQKKILIEAMTVHYLPAYLRLKDYLPRLGQIKIVSLNYSQYSSRYDRFKAGEILPAFDPLKAGGALMDLNVYNLHFLIGLFGAPKSAFYSANIERNIDTSGIMLLDYEDFKAVCIAAKDCQAPVTLSIQGEKGCISIPMPANIMDNFSLNLNAQPPQQYSFENQHRMLPEFQKFISIIARQDFAFAEKMLDISEAAVALLDTHKCKIQD
ncbi:putative dehydrogenase [Mesocricetibacter intestinalis]|uniref:Putative dehydrogenase n=1 Tax=Mesocricetibacter intestinalis TaxID=1521930 RepID=A0A4R6VG22_9PAST|nr:Gfo/Idh/MocA family oxidoreductase [Mesocricetibacter intestinalis]TDQ59749.1 putative dehydrogenase [Mesocricetibacter intestinalis]